LALAKPVGVSKKFCLLDIAGSSHGPHTTDITTTHAAQVPTFDNLSNDSSLDVHRTPSHVWMIERHASPPPSVSGEFLCFSLAFVTTGPDNRFTGVAQPLPSLGFPLEDLDENLESCVCRISFVLPSYFHTFVLALIDCSILQALALSKKQRVERAIESSQIAKNAELEVLVRAQAEKITELETAYADLKREKGNVTIGYRRLVAKHDAFVEKVEQEKAKLAEAHAAEVAKFRGDLDLEMRSYTEYLQTVWHQLRKLHETVASSFDEVQAQCLSFLDKGAKVEEMIDWVIGEVKAMPDTVWWLNNNFIILGIEGVLNMLNGEGCQELGRLRDLAASRDAVVLEDVPKDVHKLAG
jgi:hypothetical protein